MANITAADVNKLRQMTGAGMMDCKNALKENDGDFDLAIESLRKKGQKLANKRADRDANEGIVIAKRNRGLNSAFTVRKISHNVGVERVFQTYSPVVDSITVKRRGDVRRAKLYYLRNLAGRAARIKEKLAGKKADK